jgi:hypothetical protein
MLEEVAGEREIDRLFHQFPDLDRRSDDRLNPDFWGELNTRSSFGPTRPRRSEPF